MRSVIALLAAALFAACAAPVSRNEPIVAQGAFKGGMIRVRTIESDSTGQREMPIVLSLLPFQNETGDKGLDPEGRALEDLIAGRLAARTGAFKLVERARLQAIYDELKLGDVGPVDQSTAVRIGGLLGANVIALGSIERLSSDTLFDVRLVKVETGEVVGGLTERSSPGAEDAIARDMADRIAVALGAAPAAAP